MIILQTLFALVGKAAGKILNAIFGWAVRALFGETSASGRTFLSGLVGAAVAWPLLLLGLIKPKIAVLLLAFVPLPHWVPSWIVRLAWLALVLVIPFALGLAIAAKAPPGAPRESFVKRMLRGFPITLGLASAFIVMFVSVPVIRLVALMRKQKSASVPLATDAAAYHQVAEIAVGVLNHHRFGLRPAAPGWWVAAPMRLLTWFAGEALRAFVPKKLEYFESKDLTVSFYTSGVLLTGLRQHVTWAEGLIAEAVTRTDGLQTFTPAAQEIERRIRRAWKVCQQANQASSKPMRPIGQVDEIARTLGKLDVDFDEWQILYRQVMQLARAARGQPQLIEESCEPGQLGQPGQPVDDGARANGTQVGRDAEGEWDQATLQDMDVDVAELGGAMGLVSRSVSPVSSDELFRRIINELAPKRT